MIFVRSLAFGLSLFLATGLAFAQETQAPGEIPEERPTGIESITVTAEKRESDLQDTAISITAFGSGDLDRFGVFRTEDIGNHTPGLQINQFSTPTHTQLHIRGVGEGDFHPAVQARVAQYLDGVYLGNQTGAATTLMDIERIEILRGPQGTLYGRNTIGGLMNVVTKQPGPELGAKIRVNAGEHGLFEVRSTVNIPLIGERLAARISYYKGERDSFDKDSPDGFKLWNMHRWGIRGNLQWLVNDDITLNYMFMRTDADEGEVPFRLSGKIPEECGRNASGGISCIPALSNGRIAGGILTGGLAAALAAEPTSKIGDPLNSHQFLCDGRAITARVGGSCLPGRFRPGFDSTTWMHSVVASVELTDALTVKSITSWRKVHNRGASDLDGTRFFLIEGWSHSFHDQFMQELQANGTALDGKLDFSFGVNWFNDKFKHITESNVLTGCGPFSPSTCGLTIAAPPLSTSPANSEGKGWALGGYSQVSYHLTDRFTLTGGLRYTAERKEAVYEGLSFQGARRFDSWTPLVRAEYHVTDDILTYIGWSKGYKSGGFDQRPGAAATRSGGFDEENLFAWEGGVKSTLMDRRLRLNVSGYYYDWDDRQIQIFDAEDFTGVIRNAGKSRVRGFEIEMVALPFAGVDVRLGHSWNYSDYSEFMDLDPRDGTPINRASMTECLVDGTNRVCPVRPTGTPTRTFSGSVQYTFPTMDFGQVSASMSFRRTGAIEWDPDQQAESEGVDTSHYTIYDARIQIDDILGNDGLSLALVGRNIFDREYRQNGSATAAPFGTFVHRWGEPRAVWVEVAGKIGGID